MNKVSLSSGIITIMLLVSLSSINYIVSESVFLSSKNIGYATSNVKVYACSCYIEGFIVVASPAQLSTVIINGRSGNLKYFSFLVQMSKVSILCDENCGTVTM